MSARGKSKGCCSLAVWVLLGSQSWLQTKSEKVLVPRSVALEALVVSPVLLLGLSLP